MLAIDNILKAWNTGQYLGDFLLGNATALPGFVFDGLINASLSENNQYDFTNLDYFTDNALDHATFSSIFAMPGKLIGNTVIPLVFTVAAIAFLAPNLVMRLIDKAYQKIKDLTDKLIFFLSSDDARLRVADHDYSYKAYLIGKVLLGKLVGTITTLPGIIIDGLLSFVGINTHGMFTFITMTIGEELGGLIGGVVSGVVGAILHPVKKLLDTVFETYREFRTVLDKIAAFCMNKNGCNPAEARLGSEASPHIYSEKFRARARHVSTTQLTTVGLYRWLRQSNRAAREAAEAARAAEQATRNTEQLVVNAAAQVAAENAAAIPESLNNNDWGKDPWSLELLNDTAIIICDNDHSANEESAENIKRFGKCPCCKGTLLEEFIPNTAVRELINEHKRTTSVVAASM